MVKVISQAGNFKKIAELKRTKSYYEVNLEDYKMMTLFSMAFLILFLLIAIFSFLVSLDEYFKVSVILLVSAIIYQSVAKYKTESTKEKLIDLDKELERIQNEQKIRS